MRTSWLISLECLLDATVIGNELLSFILYVDESVCTIRMDGIRDRLILVGKPALSALFE